LDGSDGYKSKFFRFGQFFIKDGSQIRFLEDKWLGNASLREKYPALYSIVHYKCDTIAKVMVTSPPDVTFRRDLVGQRLVAWNALLQQLATIQLSAEPDEFRWNLHKNGEFSVDFMYNALIYLHVQVDSNKMIWKMKIPLKIKVFGWYLRSWSYSHQRQSCLNEIGMGIRVVFFVIRVRLLNTSFSNVGSQGQYGQLSK
jgi:hypothetical protein